MRRRSMAVLLLMVVLTVAPSLARAAIACAPHCCPASATTTDGDDCRSGFANRTCCVDASAPLAAFASFAPGASDLPGFLPAILPAPMASAAELLRVPMRSAAAELSLRTSPLRLSVVLLI
jgi:hypothetical protein